MPISETSSPKYVRHLPAQFCTPHTGQYNVTTHGENYRGQYNVALYPIDQQRITMHAAMRACWRWMAVSGNGDSNTVVRCATGRHNGRSL